MLEIIKHTKIAEGPTIEVYADLHAFRADVIKSSSHALHELDDLVEALVTDAPGTVDEEDQVCLGTFTHCGADRARSE